MGNNEDASPEMRGSDIGSRKCEGTGSVAQHVQVSPHVGQPTSGTGGDVFDDDPRRARGFDDPPELVPESGSLSREAFALACRRDVLAGESTAEEIDTRELRADFSDIIKPRYVGPVLREHGATEWIRLHLEEHGPQAGPFEPELQAADAGEE